MARTKYKIGQMLQTTEGNGVVNEIRLRSDTTDYVLDNDNIVKEDDVTAVFRPVATRAKKSASKLKSTKRGKAAEAQAAA